MIDSTLEIIMHVLITNVYFFNTNKLLLKSISNYDLSVYVASI